MRSRTSWMLLSSETVTARLSITDSVLLRAPLGPALRPPSMDVYDISRDSEPFQVGSCKPRRSQSYLRKHHYQQQ